MLWSVYYQENRFLVSVTVPLRMQNLQLAQHEGMQKWLKYLTQ